MRIVEGFVVGVDPGVTRTGVVIMNGDKVVLAGATFHSSGKAYTKYCKGCRVRDLAAEIIRWVDDMLWNIPATEPDVKLSIETPVMGKGGNVAGFALQWRLFQAIVDNLEHYVCIEVHNTRAKIAATGSGDAKKPQMVEASPFSFADFPDTKSGREDCEALADAYAIGLVAYLPVGENTYTIGDRDLACHDGPVWET